MKDKKNKIFLYVLVVIIILLVCYLAYKFIITKSEYGNFNDVDTDSNEEATIIPVPKQDYPVVYKGYEYSLLDGYYYKIDNNDGAEIFVIYKSGIAPKTRIIIKNVTDYPDNSFTNIDILSDFLEQNGYDLKNIQTLEIENNTVFTFEYQYDDDAAIVAYMKAYDDYIYKMIVFDYDDKGYNYDTLNDVVKMLNTRKKLMNK